MKNDRIYATYIPYVAVDEIVIKIGPHQHFDVTDQILGMKLGEIRRLKDRTDTTDILIDLSKVEYFDLFDVIVEAAVCEFFGVNNLSEITYEMLIRERSKIRRRPKSKIAPLKDSTGDS